MSTKWKQQTRRFQELTRAGYKMIEFASPLNRDGMIHGRFVLRCDTSNKYIETKSLDWLVSPHEFEKYLDKFRMDMVAKYCQPEPEKEAPAPEPPQQEEPQPHERDAIAVLEGTRDLLTKRFDTVGRVLKGFEQTRVDICEDIKALGHVIEILKGGTQ